MGIPLGVENLLPLHNKISKSIVESFSQNMHSCEVTAINGGYKGNGDTKPIPLCSNTSNWMNFQVFPIFCV